MNSHKPTVACSPHRLSTSVWVAVVAVVVVLMAAPAIPAQDEVENDYGATRIGESLFAAYCTSCHGATAEGDGPLASSLRVEPANLTELKRTNEGAFPFDRVVERIDGTEKVKGHGTSDMPIWGKAFKKVDETATDDMVQDKVRALAFYVKSLQVAG